jgi:hypothetical protein
MKLVRVRKWGKEEAKISWGYKVFLFECNL